MPAMKARTGNLYVLEEGAVRCCLLAFSPPSFSRSFAEDFFLSSSSRERFIIPSLKAQL